MQKKIHGFRVPKDFARRQRAIFDCPEKTKIRFWAKVRKTKTCWLFMTTNAQGYGTLSFMYRVYLAHRVSLIWATGKIKEVKIACHRCRNKNCVRPDHLYWGSPKENTHDFVKDHKLEDMVVNFRGCTRKEKDDIAIYATEEIREKFWSHVNKTGDCWHFNGKQKASSELFSMGGYNDHVTRIALLWSAGAPPTKNHVATTMCGSRNCVNSAHLRWITKTELFAGRATPWATGENSHLTQLTADQVRAMRALYAQGNHTHRQIGALFNLSESGAGHILRRKTWKHV